jgi:hypothetical protein
MAVNLLCDVVKSLYDSLAYVSLLILQICVIFALQLPTVSGFTLLYPLRMNVLYILVQIITTLNNFF